MISVYHAPTIAGTGYVVRLDGGSWFIPECIGGWTLRRPFRETTVTLTRLVPSEERFALLKAGVKA